MWRNWLLLLLVTLFTTLLILMIITAFYVPSSSNTTIKIKDIVTNRTSHTGTIEVWIKVGYKSGTKTSQLLTYKEAQETSQKILSDTSISEPFEFIVQALGNSIYQLENKAFLGVRVRLLVPYNATSNEQFEYVKGTVSVFSE